MPSLKAPGSDGLQGVFYKKCWDTVGESLVVFVQDFFGGRGLDPEVSFAHVVLIAKCNGAESVDKIRPISLCKFSFKLITKIITARLRPHLDDMISSYQSVFVPGRWIAENTIVARKVMD